MITPFMIEPNLCNHITEILKIAPIKETPYLYKGKYVPRVTTILSDMLHEDSLMSWSNYIGLKQQKYREVLDTAAIIGTLTHNAIEDFLQHGKIPTFTHEDPEVVRKAKNAFDSFLAWWMIITMKNEVNILMQESPLVCDWYGGTLDLLLQINSKIYIIDFKTSNHPSYKYWLQISAYKNILENYLNIHIDGGAIIMLNKERPVFEELVLETENPIHAQYFEHCRETFMSLLYSYYNRQNIEDQYKKIFNDKGE